MSVERMNPPSLSEPQGFVHVTVGTGSRLVFLAGQVATDQDGALVGDGDLVAQTAQVVRNVHAALAAADATFDDVAKVTIYVVDWHEDKLEQLTSGVMAAAGELGAAPLAATTLIPVPRLFEPGYLIEMDVTAVVD